MYLLFLPFLSSCKDARVCVCVLGSNCVVGWWAHVMSDKVQSRINENVIIVSEGAVRALAD